MFLLNEMIKRESRVYVDRHASRAENRGGPRTWSSLVIFYGICGMISHGKKR
jgi:hypothetical protein